MNKSTIILLLTAAMVLSFAQTLQAKPKKTQVYMFGFSASFTDSIAYMTQVQLIDPVYIESKTGFLYDRSLYSQQLQTFVEVYDKRPNTTCAVFFSRSKNAMDRKYASLLQMYKAKNELTIKELTSECFHFIPEEWTEHESSDVQTKDSKKEGAKNEKEGSVPEGGMPPSINNQY